MPPSESTPAEKEVPDQPNRHHAPQDDDMSKTKARSRVDGKWELVPAYKLAYIDLRDWLERHFEGKYDLPEYGADLEVNEAEERQTVKEDYYRIILPRALKKEEKAEIDRTLRKEPNEEGVMRAWKDNVDHWSDEDDEEDIEHGNRSDERGVEGARAPSRNDSVAAARQEDHDAGPRSPKFLGSNAANTEK